MNHKTKKRTKAVILAVVMTFSTVAFYSFGAVNSGFTDTTGHWAEEYIDRWTADGVIFGYGDGTFQPDNNVTRAEFSSILNQLYTHPTIVPNTFADVCDTDWHSEIFQRLVASGVVIPDANNRIHPNVALNRGELFAMVARAFEIDPIPGNTTFLDNASIEASIRPYVRALHDAGLVTGYEERGGFEIRADRLLTRAEMLVVLDRANTMRLESLETRPAQGPATARPNTNSSSFREPPMPSPGHIPATLTPTTLPPQGTHTPTPTTMPPLSVHTPTPTTMPPLSTHTPTQPTGTPVSEHTQMPNTPTQTPFHTPTPVQFSPSFTSTPTPTIFIATPTPMPQNPTVTPTPIPFTPSPTIVQVITPPQVPSQPSSTNATEFELEVLRLVNIERANHGLPPVEWDDRAATAARGHSVDMVTRGFFAHICPSGRGPRERLRAVGHTMGGTYRSSAENISRGRPTPQIAVTAWMNSGQHRINILNREYTHMGAGFHQNFWTQLFLTMR